MCCASEQQPLQTFTQQQTAAAAPVPKKIGTFTNIFHDIAGTAYALNSTTILIKGFNYDGEGPDAFFLGGTHGRPSKSGEVFLFSQVFDLHVSEEEIFQSCIIFLLKVVMPYPFEGRHFNYRDKNIPILGRSDFHFELINKLD